MQEIARCSGGRKGEREGGSHTQSWRADGYTHRVMSREGCADLQSRCTSELESPALACEHSAEFMSELVCAVFSQPGWQDKDLEQE